MGASDSIPSNDNQLIMTCFFVIQDRNGIFRWVVPQNSPVSAPHLGTSEDSSTLKEGNPSNTIMEKSAIIFRLPGSETEIPRLADYVQNFFHLIWATDYISKDDFRSAWDLKDPPMPIFPQLQDGILQQNAMSTTPPIVDDLDGARQKFNMIMTDRKMFQEIIHTGHTCVVFRLNNLTEMSDLVMYGHLLKYPDSNTKIPENTRLHKILIDKINDVPGLPEFLQSATLPDVNEDTNYFKDVNIMPDIMPDNNDEKTYSEDQGGVPSKSLTFIRELIQRANKLYSDKVVSFCINPPRLKTSERQDIHQILANAKETTLPNQSKFMRTVLKNTKKLEYLKTPTGALKTLALGGVVAAVGTLAYNKRKVIGTFLKGMFNRGEYIIDTSENIDGSLARIENMIEQLQCPKKEKEEILEQIKYSRKKITLIAKNTKKSNVSIPKVMSEITTTT